MVAQTGRCETSPVCDCSTQTRQWAPGGRTVNTHNFLPGYRTKRRFSLTTDTSSFSRVRFLRAGEESSSTFLCPPPWYGIAPLNVSPRVVRCWLCFRPSLTRAWTSFNRWRRETGTSPTSWPTTTRGTSCQFGGLLTCTFAVSNYLRSLPRLLFQILPEHRRRPQTETLVQVGASSAPVAARVRLAYGFRSIKSRAYNGVFQHGHDSSVQPLLPVLPVQVRLRGRGI